MNKNATSEITAGSFEKRSGSTGIVARTSARKTNPPNQPHWIMRSPRRRASAASPAPSACPIIACAAIATASSAKARADQIWNAISWAARSASPSRAATATVTVRPPRSAAVRTRRSAPAPASRPMMRQSGLSPTPCTAIARAIHTRYAIAPTHWAMTVESADAPIPKSRPKISTTSVTRLSTAVPIAT